MRAVKATFDPQGILNPGSFLEHCRVMIPTELSEQVYNCIKCGPCSNTCPVYAQLRFEGVSPRGKVQLIKKILEGKLEISENFARLLGTCLLCETCMVNCPSGVGLDRLMKAMRADVVANSLPWREAGAHLLLSGPHFAAFRRFLGASWSLCAAAA